VVDGGRVDDVRRGAVVEGDAVRCGEDPREVDTGGVVVDVVVTGLPVTGSVVTVFDAPDEETSGRAATGVVDGSCRLGPACGTRSGGPSEQPTVNAPTSTTAQTPGRRAIPSIRRAGPAP